jgi:TatD DNase family protein
VIHTRASVTAALDALTDAGAPSRLVFHCWSGDRDELRRALNLGAYVSFAGNVSFKNAANLRAAAAEVPASRLLVETDAPFLTPVPHRGRRNEPAYVPLVGRGIAAARGESVEEVEAHTYLAACELFGLAPER